LSTWVYSLEELDLKTSSEISARFDTAYAIVLCLFGSVFAATSGNQTQ